MQIIELYPVSGQESAQPRRIPSVAFELDGDKRWLYLSPNATELLGLNPVHLLGTSLFLAIDPENHLEVLDLFSRFSRTPFHGPAAFTFKNLQTHRPVSMTGTAATRVRDPSAGILCSGSRQGGRGWRGGG